MSQTIHPVQNLLSLVGSQANPIGILDQDQQKNLYDHLLELSRNQQIIKKALLCKTSLDIVLAIIMTKFSGQFYYKEECLKKEIVQYFYDKVRINILYESFTPRFQPDYSNEQTKPFGIGLIVHGVDFLDTRQIGKMFSSPIEDSKGIIQKIIWIDDSNVEIIFFNPQIAQVVIQKLTANVKKDQVKMQQETTTQLTRGWFEVNSYDIFGIKRKLFARYSTTLEVDLKKKSQFSRYTIFQNAQKGLQLYLLTKFQAFENFESIMKQIEYEKYGKSVLSQTRYFHQVKPLIEGKLDRYMSEGKRHLNLNLNFNKQHRKPIDHRSKPKGQEGAEIIQVENHFDISLIERNENIQMQQISLDDISVIDNKQNAMINEEDQRNPIDNLLSQLNSDKAEPLVIQDVQKGQVMTVQEPEPIQIQKPHFESSSCSNNGKIEASFSSDMLLNLLKQMNQLSSSSRQDKLQINPDNLKFIISQLTVKQDTSKNTVMQKQVTQKQVLQSKPKDIGKNDQQENQPITKYNEVFKKQNQHKPSDNKGKNMNGNGQHEKIYKQSNQMLQRSVNGNFKPKPSGNNYQKNQSKSSKPGDDFYEPSSY